MNPKLVKAIFLQFSGIVGAGIFTLPYLFYHSNFIFSVFLLSTIAVITIILNIFYIEIILKTPGDHQLSGYAEIYLGKFFKVVSSLSIFLIAFGALLVYMKLASVFLAVIFPFLSGILGIIFFLLIFTVTNFLHLKPSGKFFEALPFLIFISIILIFFFSLKFPSSTLISFSAPSISFLGIIIFTISGFTIIPEIEELLRSTYHKKEYLIKSSIIGTLISVLVYTLFTYSIIKINGSSVSPDTISGLVASHPLVAKSLALLGLVIIFKAGLNMILIIKEVFYRDFSISQKKSYLLSSLIPFSIFLFLSVSFLSIISVTGAVSVALSAIIICLMRLKISHSILVDVFIFLIIFTFVVGLLSIFPL